MQVICLPRILHVSLRYGTRLLPTLLQLTEFVERMVERLVAINQLLQLVDNGEFDFQVLLLGILQTCNELIAHLAIASKQFFQVYLLAINRGRELLLVATRIDELLTLCLYLGTTQFVECYFDSLGITTQALHGLCFQQLCKQLDKFGLALTNERLLIGCHLRFRLSLLFGRSLAKIDTGIVGCKTSLLVRKIYALCHFGLLGVNGCDNLLGLYLGSYIVHIFSIADLFRGNRLVGNFGIHTSIKV